jgi:uncharacterized protein YecT (DUF1311 family)
MKKVMTFLVMVAMASVVVIAGEKYDTIVQKADIMYQAGDKEGAEKLYQEAAVLGSAQAHYALAYQYTLTPQESVYHFSEAAKKGNQEALEYALDGLFFRANSLIIGDPQKALEVYTAAKKANPTIDYDDKKLKAITQCAESKGFNGVTFMQRYGLDDKSLDHFYSVWELAEEASRKGRFGDANATLVFDLVCRGGEVPNEMELAVDETYAKWKKGSTEEFDLCNSVMSGVGMGYCAQQAQSKADAKRQRQYDALSAKLDMPTKKLLDLASANAFSYINAKTLMEEGYGGSIAAADIITSQTQQKQEYVDLVVKVQGKFFPSVSVPFAQNDQKLNQIYQQVMKKLGTKKPEYDGQVSATNIKNVQRQWIAHRDSSAKLFFALNPAVSEENWKSYLTQMRIDDLKALGQ